MEQFLETIASFPTIFWSVPMGLVLVYWLFAVVTGLAAEGLDVDPDVEVDVDAEVEVGGLHGVVRGALEFLSVGTVPLTIIASLLSTFGFSSSFMLQWFLSPVLKPLMGGVLWGAAALMVTLLFALFATAKAVKPMRVAFQLHTIHGQGHLIGKMATITSSKVTGTFGTASIPAPDGSGPLLLNVIASRDIFEAKDKQVSIIDFDQDTNTYTVALLNVVDDDLVGEHDDLLTAARAADDNPDLPEHNETKERL